MEIVSLYALLILFWGSLSLVGVFCSFQKCSELLSFFLRLLEHHKVRSEACPICRTNLMILSVEGSEFTEVLEWSCKKLCPLLCFTSSSSSVALLTGWSRSSVNSSFGPSSSSSSYSRLQVRESPSKFTCNCHDVFNFLVDGRKSFEVVDSFCSVLESSGIFLFAFLGRLGEFSERTKERMNVCWTVTKCRLVFYDTRNTATLGPDAMMLWTLSSNDTIDVTASVKLVFYSERIACGIFFLAKVNFLKNRSYVCCHWVSLNGGG
jgi:hypothetical protein